MSIVTKKGDSGTTGLWSGERIAKDDIRVEAYGTLDELSSFIADAKHLLTNTALSDELTAIQRNLSKISGMLAAKNIDFGNPIEMSDVEELTKQTLSYEAKLGLKGLVVPGSTQASARLDIARTVARRAERCIVSLHWLEGVPEVILQYVNRLSDYLFIIARVEEAAAGKLNYLNEKLNA